MEMTAIALWLNTALAGMDAAAAEAVHGLYEAAAWFFTPFMNFVSLLGKGGAFLIALSVVMMLFPKTRRCGTCMLLALALGALMTNLLFKPLVYRPRPYSFEGSIYHEYWLLVGRHTESDYSFPSGHTTAAMAAASAVFLICDKRKSWTAFIFALLMGISRMYLSVHYLSDVIGGLIVGFTGALAAWFIVRALPEIFFTADVLRKRYNGKHLEK